MAMVDSILGGDKICFSRKSTSIARENTSPLWEEDVVLPMKGQGEVILSVMSSSMAGLVHTCLGQTVLRTEDLSNLYDRSGFYNVQLPLLYPRVPIRDEYGNEIENSGMACMLGMKNDVNPAGDTLLKLYLKSSTLY